MYESKPRRNQKSESILDAEATLRRVPELFGRVAAHYNSSENHGVFEEVLVKDQGGAATAKSFGYALIMKPEQLNQTLQKVSDSSLRRFVVVRDGDYYGVGIQPSYITGHELLEKQSKGGDLGDDSYLYLSQSDAGLTLNGVPVDLAADMDALSALHTPVFKDIEVFVRLASVASFTAPS